MNCDANGWTKNLITWTNGLSTRQISLRTRHMYFTGEQIGLHLVAGDGHLDSQIYLNVTRLGF